MEREDDSDAERDLFSRNLSHQKVRHRHRRAVQQQVGEMPPRVRLAPDRPVDQAEEIRRDGYAIDFFGTGYDVAERMNLVARLQPQQVPIEYVAYVNEAGDAVTSSVGAYQVEGIGIHLFERIDGSHFVILGLPLLELLAFLRSERLLAV